MCYIVILQYALEVDITKIAGVLYDKHMPAGHLVHILDRWAAHWGAQFKQGHVFFVRLTVCPLILIFLIILIQLRMCPQLHHQASRCTSAHTNRTCERTVQHPHSQELLRN